MTFFISCRFDFKKVLSLITDKYILSRFSKMSQEKRHLGIYENLQSMFQVSSSTHCVGAQFTIVNKIVKGGLHTFHFFSRRQIGNVRQIVFSKTGKEKKSPLEALNCVKKGRKQMTKVKSWKIVKS